MPPRPPGGDRPDRLLSVGQLAEYLNVSEAWVRERILNRTLPYTKIGKHVRFTPEQVEQIIKSGERPALRPPDSPSRRRGTARTKL